jgi:chemotaxis methyl-accepting protein methylase
VVSRIKPGGFLMTGHSETSQVRQLGLTVIKPTIYRKESH